ncbi:cytochrome P450 [Streptosporangium canum]|uniref:cytochrome P450 n=1 Tax=Streptosporangium canum TaxID=324952 RepID=UPI00379B99B1
MERVLTDPRFAKDPSHWGAWKDKRVTADWVMPWIGVDNMFTADGADHLRLRRLVSQAFTARRVEQLRGRIAQIVADLLEQMADLDGRRVDLKRALALPLPLTVISELFGVPVGDRAPLQQLCAAVFDQSLAPQETMAAYQGLQQTIAQLTALKRAQPGDDMTSALITIRDGSDQLTEAELHWTLILMIGAGYETTVNLITSAVRALLTHPDQLALVMSGSYEWQAVVEETLRWAAPIANLPFRFTREDVDLDGVIIPAGQAVLMCYGAAGRDSAQHGPHADQFDITRAPAGHLAFSHGPHFCLGAPLARMEAATALAMLFERFPNLALATPEDQLKLIPSVVGNGVASLPVTCKPQHAIGRNPKGNLVT